MNNGTWMEKKDDIFDRLPSNQVTTYTANGAIDPEDGFAILDGSSATVAGTLAQPERNKTIFIKATDVTNAVTVTPASFVDGTTITFTPANEYVELFSDTTNWYLVGGNAAIT